MTDLQKAYVLITGAGSDVGRTLALELAADYNLVITDFDEGELNRTAEIIGENSDAVVKVWSQNLLELDSLEESLAAFLTGEDILVSKFVHCAGFCRRAPLRMMKHVDYTNAFALMVTSAALIVKTLTDRKANKKALDAVILISSSSSIRGVKTFSAYGAAKAAVDGLMRNLAVELAPKVRVNSILPGAMRTRATEPMYADEEFRERAEKLYPLGIGTPDKLKAMVRLLLSEEADWITGQQFIIDGGRTADGTE